MNRNMHASPALSRLLLALTGVIALAGGCGGGDYSDVGTPVPARPTEQAGPTEPAEPAAPVEAAEPKREVAGVGSGKQGRSLDEYQGGIEGAIAAPAQALFATKERVVFEIQIPKAVQLYQALHGEGPQTHEQFMNDIIKTNQIKLPPLPAGRKYVWDPAQQKLMVESAPPASAPPQ